MNLTAFQFNAIWLLFTAAIAQSASSVNGFGKGMEISPSLKRIDQTQIQNITKNTEQSFERDHSRERQHYAFEGMPPSSGLAILGGRLLSKPFLDVALSGVQLGLCFYVVRAIWKAIVEVVEEFETENQSSAFLSDEHDVLLFSEEGVNLATDTIARRLYHGDNNENSEESNRKDSDGGDGFPVVDDASSNSAKSVQQNTRQSAFASDLAMRLHASGLPLKKIHSVLKSLTRTEGRLLSNTLLQPDEETVFGKHGMSDRMRMRLTEMWNSIGGLDDVKEGLMDLVFPLMESQMNRENDSIADSGSGTQDGDASYYGGLLDNPPGVLLYGPPGCGKTLLVRALAGTANARFLCVSPSTLFRKYVGETNINVKALFTLARKISPCIIFIDEMEGLFRERRSSGSEEHEVSRELKTEFMQLWDGLSSNNDKIVVVGATNRPFDVDSAFLRRMPRSFFVGLPDVVARKKILSSMLLNVPLHQPFNIDSIIGEMEGYTPSDIKEVLRTAALFPLREARADVIRRREAGDFSHSLIPKLRPLQTNDVMQALTKVSPTPLTNDYKVALVEFSKKAFGISNTHSRHGYMNQEPAVDNHSNYFLTSPEVNGFSMHGDKTGLNDDDSYSYDDESDF